MKLTTTLNKIRDHHPCKEGWEKLLTYLNKTKADDEPLDLMTILESNGIEDAVWCLRCFDYKDYCLFSADVAESVLHLYTGDSDAPKAAIEAIREYHAGTITHKQLKKYVTAAAAAAAYAAYATDAAAAAAAAAADAAAAAADADAAAAAATYAADAAARKAKWAEIEQLFIKHFGAHK